MALIKLIDNPNAKSILRVIFAFLWLPDAQVSAINIFKVAMINRLCFRIIAKLYSPIMLTDFGRNHYFVTFL